MSMIIFSRFILFFTITTSVLTTLRTWAASPALLHPDELKALEEIASTLGITKLNLGYGDPCDIKKLKIDVSQDPGSENIIACDCSFNNSRTCHITEFRISDNRLNGIIPSFIGEWPQLKKIYLYASGLKGPIPYSIFRLKNLQDL